MKKIFIAYILVFAGSGCLFSETAKSIVDKADKIFEADRTYTVSTLTVYRDGKEQSTQKITGYAMRKKGRAYSLSIYNSPRRLRGMAILTIGNDLWVRFASTGRVRKLSSSAKKNSAGGSDLSYADMGDGGQGLSEKYTPVMAGDKRIDGIPCFRIELAAAKSDAPYERMVVFIAKDDYRYVQVDYFENNANIKTMTLSDYRIVNGLNYPFKIVMESHVRDSRTEVITKEFEQNSSKVKEWYFTTGYLASLQ